MRAALLETMEGAALAAGAAILSMRSGPIDVRHKADASPVTAADLAAERAIIARLEAMAPEIPILSEEAATETHPGPMPATFFVVDPLDGTKEFVAGRDEYTVNIALVTDGRPVAGVVYAPSLHVLYRGARDRGACRRRIAGGRVGAPEPIAVRPPPWTPVRIVASRSHLDDRTRRFLDGSGPAEIVSIGSSLKFCLVADGSADLYPRFSPTCEWDTAAGQAVLEAAGGIVVDARGTPLTCGHAERGYLNGPFLAAAAGDPASVARMACLI